MQLDQRKMARCASCMLFAVCRNSGRQPSYSKSLLSCAPKSCLHSIGGKLKICSYLLARTVERMLNFIWNISIKGEEETCGYGNANLYNGGW